MKITMNTGDLAAVLGAAVPFVAKRGVDKPGIESVQLHATGGYLVATATDRYRAVMVRRAASGDDIPPLLITPGSIKLIMGLLTPATRRDEVTLTVEESAFGVEAVTGRQVVMVEPVDYESRETAFPRLGRIFEKALGGPADAVASIGLNPAHLTDWRKAARALGHEGPLVTWRCDEKWTVAVTIGPDFLGLAMSCYMGDNSADPAAGWSDLVKALP